MSTVKSQNAIRGAKSVSFQDDPKPMSSSSGRIGSSSSGSSRSGSGQDEECAASNHSSIEYREMMKLLEEFFEDYSDDDFVVAIRELQRELQHLRIENEVFIWNLQEYEPELLSSLEQAKANITALQSYNPLMPAYFRLSVNDETENEEEEPFMSGEKVNASQRIDMAVRYSDDIERRMDEFVASNRALRKHYENEIEEGAVRMHESIEGLYAFEKNVVVAGMDENTKRVPAERFVLYMRDWMTSAGTVTEKIRLNIASLKVVHSRLHAQYETKRELGENTQAIDYEQIRMQNQYLRATHDAKTVSIFEVKNLKALLELQLTIGKGHLQSLRRLTAQMAKMQDEVARETQKFVDDVEKTRRDIVQALHALHKVQKLADCTAPPPVDYLRVLRQLAMAEKEHKILMRKERLQKIARETYELNLLKLTRRKRVDPMWYEPLLEDDDDDDLISRRSTKIIPEFDLFKAMNIQTMRSRVRLQSL